MKGTYTIVGESHAQFTYSECPSKERHIRVTLIQVVCQMHVRLRACLHFSQAQCPRSQARFRGGNQAMHWNPQYLGARCSWNDSLKLPSTDRSVRYMLPLLLTPSSSTEKAACRSIWLSGNFRHKSSSYPTHPTYSSRMLSSIHHCCV